jgi:thymidylate synthase ThyX
MAKIYSLSPQKYSPEVIAVAFAKTSRTPDSFQDNADELNAAQAARFHEKWVLGFGHSSVAEHAVLHIAVEGISRLAAEELESCRLASYTEKSSRYQVFDRDHYFIPPELAGTTVEPLYHSTIGALLDLYQDALAPFEKLAVQKYPQGEDESPAAYAARIRTKVMDSARYVLPTAMLTNVGMTINARSLEHTLIKLLSSDLPESRMVGEEIKRVALDEVPTLVKYAERNELSGRTRAFLREKLSSEIKPLNCAVDVDLIRGESQNRMIKNLCKAFTLSNTEDSLLSGGPNLTEEITGIVIPATIRTTGFNSSIPREFEHINFSFVITLDQGAYYDVKRHRMMTQTPQPLHPFAYSMPRMFHDAGLSERFHEAMRRVSSAYQSICTLSPELARYVVPNAFHRRVFITMNFREMYNFVRLRSGKNGHPAYRAVALAVREAMESDYPYFYNLLRFAVGDDRSSAEIWNEFCSGSYFS